MPDNKDRHFHNLDPNDSEEEYLRKLNENLSRRGPKTNNSNGAEQKSPPHSKQSLKDRFEDERKRVEDETPNSSKVDEDAVEKFRRNVYEKVVENEEWLLCNDLMFRDFEEQTYIEIVEHSPGKFQDMVFDKVKAKNAKEPELFNHGGGISIVSDDKLLPMRDKDVRFYIQSRLKCGEWQLPRNKNFTFPEPRPINPIKPHVYESFISHTRRNELPKVKRIAQYPIFLPDGRLVSERGYIPEINCYLAPNFDKIDDIESLDKAVDTIRSHYQFFPWKSPEDEVRGLSYGVTLFLQHLIDGNLLLYDINSNVGGSGKGLLIESMYSFITGRVLPNISVTRDPLTRGRGLQFLINDEKLQRGVSGLLSKGVNAFHIDNLPDDSRITSEFLCSLATTAEKDFQFLYEQTLRTLETRMLVATTGVNVSFEGTLERRVITTNLESPTDRPYERDDLPDLAGNSLNPKQRSAFLGAMIRVVKEWFDRGQPLGEKNYGSFDNHFKLLSGVMPILGFEEEFKVSSQPRTPLKKELDNILITEIYDNYQDDTWESTFIPEITDLEDLYSEWFSTNGITDFTHYFTKKMLPKMVDKPYEYLGVHFDSREDRVILTLRRTEKRPYKYYLEVN